MKRSFSIVGLTFNMSGKKYTSDRRSSVMLREQMSFQALFEKVANIDGFKISFQQAQLLAIAVLL